MEAYRANGTTSTRGFYFQSNAGVSNTMYVGLVGTYAGRVGVGTTSPAEQFHATGVARVGSLKVGTSTVLDTSRNLTNIASISTGSISSGTVTIAEGVGSGTFISLRRSAGEIGKISYSASDNVAIYGTTASHGGLNFIGGGIIPMSGGVESDNTISLGDAARNFSEIFAKGMTIGSTQVIDASRNLTNIGTISSGAITASSNDRSVFGNGATGNQGIDIKYAAGNSGYGVMRFYEGATLNDKTIHIFANSWQGGNFSTVSAGAINIQGSKGVTFGTWNNIDGYVTATTGNTYFKGNLQIGDYSGSHQIEIASGQNTAGYLRFNDVNNTEGSYVRSTGATGSTGGDLVFGSRWNTDTDRIYMEMTGTAVQDPNTMFKMASGSFMFGGNNNAKESNSAQISAGQHQSNSLNFVGMASGTTSADRRMDFWVEGGAYFRGDVVATGNVTAYGSTSDKRLKKDIVKIDNAIDKIKSVSGYEFSWNKNAPEDKQGKREFGVIAQEVEEAGTR